MNAGRHVALLGAANSVHLQRWALALHAQGRQISVISQHTAQALPLPAGIGLHALPITGGVGYALNAWPLRRLLARLRPELLHVHYASGYGTLARLAAWQPMLLSVWGSDVYDFPTRGPMQAALLRANLRAAQALASTSKAMAAQVRLVWPGVGPITITPFGVDCGQFSPVGAALATHPVDRPLTLGTVKSLAPTYGIDLLLRAFAALRLQLPGTPLRLVVIGGGPQRDELLALAEMLGLEQGKGVGGVEFTGSLPHAEVPARLRQFDVYAAPSRHESFGVAVVEAMACGLPVVVSDAGGLPEVVADGVNGLVVPAGDVPALTAALARLVADADLRQRMAVASRQRALALYDWQACIDRMLACQDAVIDGAYAQVPTLL